MTQENKYDPQSNKSAREIEAAIGDTRNALTDDIKALSDKASPAHVKQEAKQAIKNAKDNLVDKAVEKSLEVKDVVIDKALEVKDVALEIKDVAVEKATEAKDVALTKLDEAGDALSEAVDEVSIRTRRVGGVAWRFTVANAVPLSLIGVGAGWLISNQRSGARRLPQPDASWDDVERDDYVADYPEDYLADDLGSARNDNYSARGRSRVGARPRAKSNGQSALNKAGVQMRKSSKNAYEKAGRSLEQTEHKLAETAVRGRDIVQERLQRVQQASRDFAVANPLALAFGTLLAGIGVGMLLPSSSREDRLLEPTRNRIRRVIGDARDAAEDASDVAKQTLRESVSRATGDGADLR